MADEWAEIRLTRKAKRLVRAYGKAVRKAVYGMEYWSPNRDKTKARKRNTRRALINYIKELESGK